jgi:hypothetical protein
MEGTQIVTRAKTGIINKNNKKQKETMLYREKKDNSLTTSVI